MPRRTSQTGSELFIVDNSDDDWKVVRYLRDWCPLSKAFDIATGYFEIGSLLALDGQWQQVDSIRILMGDEVSLRTRAAFADGLRQIVNQLDASLEAAKEKNDFLVGVPAIVEALRSRRIQCRVYRTDKFHAKCYLTHARQEVVGSFALVGSSNFTYPGITENIELNVQISGTPVAVLQEWYEEHWNEAEDVTPEILRVIERHVREYSPYEVYIRALHEICRGQRLTAGEWEVADIERGGSRMYPVLDEYQREGYHALMQIARQHSGAFLCDGVGLGKTFVGLMLIERLIMHEGKRVALFVPKTALEDVWTPALEKYLPHVGGTVAGDFSSLVLFSHTDLGRGGRFPARFRRIKELADIIVIDEAHHFRNPGRAGEEGSRRSRYRDLLDLVEGPRGKKELFMLTATPVNNKLHDFRHMAELFTLQDDNYFAGSLGIHSLRRHFVDMERELLATVPASDPSAETNLVEAENVLARDRVFKALVVQRSRAYVVRSQQQQGRSVASFPIREPPIVADYSIKRTYGRLLDKVDQAFRKGKPLFTLGIYYPLAYYNGDDETIDAFENNRQKQVVGLIRTQFLKRFESSAHAFEQSCNRLLIKLLAWVHRHSETPSERRRLETWKAQHAELTHHVNERQLELFGGESEDDAEEDLITEEMLEDVEYRPRDQYNVEEIIADTFLDLDQVALFLDELRNFDSKHDDKQGAAEVARGRSRAEETQSAHFQ